MATVATVLFATACSVVAAKQDLMLYLIFQEMPRSYTASFLRTPNRSVVGQNFFITRPFQLHASPSWKILSPLGPFCCNNLDTCIYIWRAGLCWERDEDV